MPSRQIRHKRRRFRRRTVRVLVDFLVDGEVRCEYATTLGAGGMFVSTEAPIAAGEVLKLRFRLPHSPVVHEIEGRVVWSQPAGGGEADAPVRAPGMGIEFTDAAATAALGRSLERMATEP